MKKTIFKKAISVLLSLLTAAGWFALPASAESSGWSIADVEYAKGTLTVETYAEAGEMTLTLNGASVEGGEVTQSDGYYRRSFTVNTKSYSDGAKTFAFFVDGVKAAEKTVTFDNTAPYIRSWQAIDALGHRYTAYDMEVYPDDIIVLSNDETFPIDFKPTDDGCGVASVTAKLDGKSITVPYAVEYDYITAGYHNINYTLTDNLGNSYSSMVRFEVRKPAPAYSDVTVAAADGGVRISAKLSGSFTNYSAKFFFAEILKFSAKDNITSGDISAAEPAGERPFGADVNGSYITETATGGEVYQCFDVNVSGKTGKVCADYSGELAIGDRAELSVYKSGSGVWEVIKTKTSFNGSVNLNLGKNGLMISDYASGGVLKVRVRVVSDRAAKYLKMNSFVPSVRYNSQIGETQTGANGSVASVVYSGNITSSLGWYIASTADLYNSYSPTTSFTTAADTSALLEQFNAVFSGDSATRVSLAWQSEADLKTHVQLLPYGNIYPDFGSNETKNYTGSTSYSDATGKYIHKLRIAGLAPGTKYWIRYGDKNQNVWSHPCVVETASAGETFAFAACAPGGSESEVRAAWDAVSRSTGAAFVLTTGSEASGEAEWKDYFSAFSSVFNNVRAVPAAGPSGSDVWWTKYNLSEQTGAGHASGIYYSFTYENALFVVLNSNDVDVNGRLSIRQLNWANKTFNASESEWNFLLLNAKLDGDADASALAEQLTPLLDAWNVDAVFSSGGAALTCETGSETVTFDGVQYFAGAGPAYINTDTAASGMATASVDGAKLRLEYGGAAVNIYSTKRYGQLDARISALPAAENITLADMAEIRAIREAYDALDPDLSARFVTGLPKLEAAEAALAAILAVTPPELTVSGALPKK
ncbi:MAG: metallophosphoesterase family protein, partial [Clostridia bacterium]|nr:metallophosphoesterase family protein [Clostridia bacterium]